jgi:RNA polymerase sigma-70 factor (ECF subfamily)
MAAHDPSAMGELYQRHAPRLMGHLLRLVRDRAAAEDILQQVFWYAWRERGAYDRGLARPAVWLMVIARSRAMDHLRRARRAAPAPPGADAAEPPRPTPEEAEPARAARAALASLPPDQREAICLSFFRGLTHSQIAENLGVPLGTVKTRIRLGMEKLRHLLVGREEVSHT